MPTNRPATRKKAQRGAAKRANHEQAPEGPAPKQEEREVKPGFTKAEILRAKPDDPRAPGGVFERVGGLLSEMLE